MLRCWIALIKKANLHGIGEANGFGAGSPTMEMIS
jgi:hypothetical protein